jgi:penicillin-binding protein 1A
MVVDGPVSVGNWSPRNYTGKYAGRIPLLKALAHSYNSVPVRLMIDVGRPAIIETAHKVGIQGELETWPPMVLGTSSLTLLDLTSGYATFAAGGKRPRPYSVLEIRKPNGDVVYSRAKENIEWPQVVPEEKIAELNSMLRAVVKEGTARRADLGFAPQGGKTGTNQSYRDAWYVGFTAHNVTGVWVGNDDFSEMNRVTGGLIPAPIWKDVMLVAESGQTPEGLAGIPLDESYSVAAAEGTQPSADEGEAGPAAGNTAGADSGDAVTLVLNDMFNLFKDAKPKPQKKASAEKRGETLILPKPNTERKRRKSFFESLFGF